MLDDRRRRPEEQADHFFPHGNSACNCIGVEKDRGHHNWNDFDNHDRFINDFDHFEAFAELDDCEFVGWDGDEAVFVCELDF